MNQKKVTTTVVWSALLLPSLLFAAEPISPTIRVLNSLSPRSISELEIYEPPSGPTDSDRSFASCRHVEDPPVTPEARGPLSSFDNAQTLFSLFRIPGLKELEGKWVLIENAPKWEGSPPVSDSDTEPNRIPKAWYGGAYRYDESGLTVSLRRAILAIPTSEIGMLIFFYKKDSQGNDILRISSGDPFFPKFPVTINNNFSRYEFKVLFRDCSRPRSIRTVADLAWANSIATFSPKPASTSAASQQSLVSIFKNISLT